MNQLIYACRWSYNRKKSWSGTQWNVYMRLKKKFDIINFDYGIRAQDLYTPFYTLINRIGLDNDDIGLKIIDHYNIVAKKKFKEEKCFSLQFEECPYQKNIYSYIYNDLCYGFIKSKLESHDTTIFMSDYNYNSVCMREKKQHKFYLAETTKILTMGQWLKKWLIKEYNIPAEKVFHVGGGINLDASQIDYSHKQGNKILFVGKDFVRKNGPLVIQAFNIAKQQQPNIELYIIGPKKENYLHYNMEGIHWLGNLPFDQLPRWFNLCDIFCMPSLFEAYGLVFPEALTFGLPCIGRNTFEMPYFIEDGVNGVILKKDTVDECSRAILWLLNNDIIKKNVKNNREIYLNEYSWDTVVSRIERIIQKDIYDKKM